MKRFEISSKSDSGHKKFKAILYKIYSDSCVDEVNEVGTEYNHNGITWIKEYCENALDSIKDASIRCVFTDEERSEILDHGFTGVDPKTNMPTYEDAVVIGHFTNGYIDEVETEDGVITACIGEGVIDSQCYHNLVEKLEDDAANGIYPDGSIEITRTEDNDEIIYKYGYKDKGRIPMVFKHSGYAILSARPADDYAKLIELNQKHKEELDEMTDVEIKALITQTVEELSTHTAEMNKCKEECEAQVATAIAEKNEISASAEQIQKALDELRAEYSALDKKYNELCEERNALEKALGEAKAKERIAELEAAISEFSETEKDYAKAEIEAFKADPEKVEINTVTDKIWQEIGKVSREQEKKEIAEQNAFKVDVEDIFSEVVEANDSDEDTNIF